MHDSVLITFTFGNNRLVVKTVFFFRGIKRDFSSLMDILAFRPSDKKKIKNTGLKSRPAWPSRVKRKREQFPSLLPCSLCFL